jgi:mono/diheme cytochrome c family protein
VGEDARITMPLAFGSHKSKLTEPFLKRLRSNPPKITQEEWLRVVTWIDANAPYHDGFINKRLAQMPYDLPNDGPLLQEITAVHAKRCAGCHDAAAVSRLDWIDLARPGQSRFLAAPLSKSASGLGKCAKAVYRDQSDPDYRNLRQLVESAVKKAWQFPRRDVKSLVAVPDKSRNTPQPLSSTSPPIR